MFSVHTKTQSSVFKFLRFQERYPKAPFSVDNFSGLVWTEAISFPELRSPRPAVGKRELWEHPFSNNNGNNRILHIRFYCMRAQCAVCMYGIYGACLKWMLPELSFSDRWSWGTKLWERDWCGGKALVNLLSIFLLESFTLGEA